MKPVIFKNSNCIYAENQKEYLSLPAYKHGDPTGTVTSCWQMSFRERFKVLCTGKIYLSLLTFNKPLTPQLLDVNNPAYDESLNPGAKQLTRLNKIAKLIGIQMDRQ